MPRDPDLIVAVRRLAAAATIATKRHPGCGAIGAFNAALRDLPAELCVDVGDITPHPEDDLDDAAAELRRLTKENAVLRRRLAEAESRQLSLLESLGVDR